MRSLFFIAALVGAATLARGGGPGPEPTGLPAAAPVRVVATGYSFARAPFVHPGIVRELWTPPVGDAPRNEISLTDAARDDRYPGEVETFPLDPECPLVRWQEEPNSYGSYESFAYRYLGMTDLGVQVFHTLWSGGGSGVFSDLLFAVIESADAPPLPDAGEGPVVSADGEPIVLRKLGEVGLGDRWSGELRLRGNEVLIGEDTGWFADHPDYAGARPARSHLVEFTPPAPLDLVAHRESCAVRE